MRVMNFLRYMKTMQERRRYIADTSEVRLRASRSARNLPTVWDDFWRYPQRSWKENRRHKWRRIKDL